MGSIWALVINSKNLIRLCWLTLLCWSGVSFAASATQDTVYLTREAFLKQAFDGQDYEAKLLWLTGDLREQVADILGHPPRSARIRYWQNGERRAWILEEIGKERLITAGFVIDHNVIRAVDVLVYRESRGWEVRNKVFTQQFEAAQLQEQHKLSHAIDNISGATLSVSAMRQMARVALTLNQQLASP